VIDFSNPSVFSSKVRHEGRNRHSLEIHKGEAVIYRHPRLLDFKKAMTLGRDLQRRFKADYEARQEGAHYSPTEPTQAGLQYVIPGCEKDQSRNPNKQMELF